MRDNNCAVSAMALNSRNIGVLIAPGYDEPQLSRVTQMLCLKGASVQLISNVDNRSVVVPGGRGSLVMVDRILEDVDAADMDGLVITGGESIDRLASDEKVLTLMLRLQLANKPIAASGNGSLVMAAAGLVAGRRVTGAAGIKKKINEAGGSYQDQKLVVDHNLVTAFSDIEVKHLVEAMVFLLEPATTYG